MWFFPRKNKKLQTSWAMTTNKGGKMKRPENKRMETFLAENGIKAKATYWWKGSMKRTWTIQSRTEKWTDELLNKFTALGFRNWDGQALKFLANSGDDLYLCVTGHLEMAEGLAAGSR